MKIIPLLLFLTLSLIMGGIIFAESVDLVSGKVEKVDLADPEKGIKSEISIVTEDGTKISVLVKTNTTIYDAGWKAIGLDKIREGNRVKIKYLTSKEGVREARSLSLVK
ncbi:MAG: hypothetical protein NT033_06825 [Candidatus Omnitrophica bacterium]|nr:hypothetical protein [Candidatus Omnitrophota bacterium]